MGLKQDIDAQHASYEEIGDHHAAGDATQTPMRDNASDLSDDQKMDIISEKVYDIMHALGMDMTDDSLKGTPFRVAKMYVHEIFGGLRPETKPKMSTFENSYRYGENAGGEEHHAVFDL